METELIHYGVKGMKWGVRRAQRKAARQVYRSAKNQAFDRYERDIAAIEKPYKRGQNLSDRDLKREAAAEKRYSDAVAKAKADYKTTKAEQEFARSRLTSTRHPKDVRANVARVKNYRMDTILAGIGAGVVGHIAAQNLGYGTVGRAVAGCMGGYLGAMAVSTLYPDIRYKDKAQQ